MAHPLKHAESSAKKFGGQAEDYLAVHQWFDESKAFFADFRHRALRHHAEGIFLSERIFGVTITNSEGNQVPSGISENNTSRKTWVEFRRPRTGCHRSSHNAGCMASV